MPDLKSQRMVAARIMKCGQTRVWMDPSRSADIAEAITAEDLRKLIEEGVVKKIQKQGVSRYRKNLIRKQKLKGRRRGRGSRKGATQTRQPRKKLWMQRVRAIRKLIQELRSSKRIDGKTYRYIYVQSKSGQFRSKSHVMIYLERNKLLKEQKGAGNV